jgi:hypothetical protein
MTTIESNVIDENGVNGLFVYFTSTFNDLLSNIVKENGKKYADKQIVNVKAYGTTAGVVIDSASRSNKLFANNLESNTEGLSNIGASENNQIYHNDFKKNRDRQAFDNSFSIWNSPDSGNYWSDYEGEDSDGDGIGDSGYDIPGGDNEDEKPLINPITPLIPTISGPSEVEVGEPISYHIKTLQPIYEEVIYLINWGDAIDWERSEPCSPDEGYTFIHTWESEKTFRVRVRAVVIEKGDTRNSEPSEYFPVRVPHKIDSVDEDSSKNLVINDLGDILKSIFSRFQNSKIFFNF